MCRSWDPEHGPGDTKNRNRRRVPVVGDPPGLTLDRYGHLMPGNEAEAAQLLDCHLNAKTA